MFLEHIEKIAATSSRKEKEAILAEVNDWNSDDKDLFLKSLQYAYSPMKEYYIKDVDFLDVLGHSEKATRKIGDVFDLLDSLASRDISGNDAQMRVADMYYLLSPEDAVFFKRILTRDMRCGISSKTINKVFPKLIYEHPYMRCSTLNDKTIKKLKYPCFSQTKMDGLYVDVMVYSEHVVYRSRSGKILRLNEESRDRMLAEEYPMMVLQGEALVLSEDDEYLPREEGNGYINSDDFDPSMVRIIVWDCVSINDFMNKESKVPYKQRLENLRGGLLAANPSFGISAIKNVWCKNFEHVVSEFQKSRAAGNEGTVIKNIDMPWKDGTSPNQLKVKVAVDCDLKIVGWNEGHGKFKGMVGSIICECADGIVEVGVSGFSDAFRKEATDKIQSWIDDGKIMTVKYNDVIESDLKPGMKSLFLPRFVELREDKTEADSLDKITEQLSQFKL